MNSSDVMLIRFLNLKRQSYLRYASRGQSLVEFALVLPFLVLFVIGLFDVGYAVYVNTTLANAAREGARKAIVNTDDNQVKKQVVDMAIGVKLSTSNVTVTRTNCVAGDTSCACYGTTDQSIISVAVAYTYSSLTGAFSGFPINKTATMCGE